MRRSQQRHYDEDDADSDDRDDGNDQTTNKTRGNDSDDEQETDEQEDERRQQLSDDEHNPRQDNDRDDADDQDQDDRGDVEQQEEDDADDIAEARPRPSVVARTKSDPLPSQEQERDKADADYHPEIVMLPDDPPFDDEIKFTATLDSGCEDNWISLTKMEENKLGVDDIQALPEGEQAGELSSTFTDFSGNDVSPYGQVQLRWRASGSGKSENTVFYVIDNESAPFDCLFGRTFMDEHDGGPNFFKKPVLINAGKPLTPAEAARKKLRLAGNTEPEEKETAEEESAPEQPLAIEDEPEDAAPPAEEKAHGFSKWGKGLSGRFSKLHH